MDTRNVIAAISLSACVILLWGLFFSPPAKNVNQLENQETNKQIVNNSEAPKIEQTEIVKEITRSEAINSSQRIMFENKFIKGSISLNNGGAIDDFVFKDYNQTLGSEEKIVLLNPSNVKDGYFFNTGWATNSDAEVPNSNTVWKIKSGTKLTPKNPIVLIYENNQGIVFERKITLDEKYLFSVEQNIKNNTDKTYKFYPYSILHRNSLPVDLTDFYILHEGYTLLADGELEEIDYKDVEEKKFTKEANSGYLVIGDKYWMTSILPPQDRKFRVDIDYKKKYRASYIDLSGYEAGPNSSVSHNINSLIGAKEIELIDQYTDELKIEKLDLIVNYGVLYFIVKPLWFILDYLFKLTGNYGYAIIILTFLVRLVFFPLNQYSMKSMGKMKHLAKPMQALKDRYKDDKQKLQQEIMKMYKANGVNPASSCIPILLQIPIFFSLYKLLLLDIAMRHAPFVWIWEDLAAKDPVTIFNLFGLLPYDVPDFLGIGLLPILMGGSMFLQMQLSPQAVGDDPAQVMQRKLFKWFPLFITFILAPFASGLILYWTCTNILTIIQQWIINKNLKVKD